MKELRIDLVSPPQGVYFPGMMVTGVVIFSTEEPEDYKQILVTLNGGAKVHWEERRTTGNDSTTYFYTSTENYMNAQAVVWDNVSAGGGKLPAGSYRFNFSFQLAQGIPPSYTGRVGSIVYSLEARVVYPEPHYKDITAVLNLSVGSIVQLGPQLMQPVSSEVRKTVGFLCCESGPIVMTAKIPRTGFCIGRDAIPVEITVANGSDRVMDYIRVSLQQCITYTAEGHHKYDETNCVTYNTRPISPRESTTLQLEPMQIPADTTPTLDDSCCKIVNITYCVNVYGQVMFGFNPMIKLPVVIGNVAADTSAGGGANLQPPSIPSTTAGNNVQVPPTAATTWEPPPSYPSEPVPLGFDQVKETKN